jgi:hypothetical protein
MFIGQSEDSLNLQLNGCQRQLQLWFRMQFSAASLLRLPIKNAKYP